MFGHPRFSSSDVMVTLVELFVDVSLKSMSSVNMSSYMSVVLVVLDVGSVDTES